RVHGVVLAVVYRDADVLQGEAGQRALGEHLADALLHRRDELTGDSSADDVVDELEARAAVQRLDAQVHLTELTGAAGLLLVAAMALGRAGDGLTIGDAGGVGLHVHAVPLPHPLQQGAQVQLAGAIEDGLVDRGVVLDADAGIFRGELVQRVGEALLVAATLRLYGQAQHRRREGDGLQVILILVMGVVQHGIEVQLLHFGDRADIAGNGFGDLLGILAQEPVQVRDLERLARIAHEQLRAGAGGALMHAQDTELADVGVDSDLENVRDDVLAGIGRHGHALRPLARALEEWRRVAFGRIRQKSRENPQQLPDAGAGLSRSEAHRNEMALTEGLLERVVELLRGDLLALLEIDRHELLVELDHLVDELRMRQLHGGEVGLRAVRLKKTI